MITEDYVSFETAKLLKEKGFDELCIFKYNYEGIRMKAGIAIDEWQNSELDDNECSCPTHQVAMKWLREVHKLYITISHRFSHNADQDVCFSYYINVDRAEDGEYMTYEEAAEAALKYSLKNLI